MTPSFLSQVDWSQPWLAPFRAMAAPIVQAADWRLALNAAAEERALKNHRNLPLRFVPQACLPAGMAYESFISETACVPTRDNLHDFFNALVWLAYPQTKSRLNALQAAAIANAGTTAVRGKLRDALTIFDENAALFISHGEALASALRQHRWKDLFIEQRSAYGHDYRVQLFGHALMEKLVSPYKAITAHAWIISLEEELDTVLKEASFGLLDSLIATRLSDTFTTSFFTPLPVLGVPGWREEQDEEFYNDTTVFRAKRPFR